MSFVTLILIKNKQLNFISAHYTIIKRILLHKDFQAELLKQTDQIFIDAGYILVDCDANVIIDAQNAFAVKEFEDFQHIII